MFAEDIKTIRKALIQSMTHILSITRSTEERFSNERAFFIKEAEQRQANYDLEKAKVMKLEQALKHEKEFLLKQQVDEYVG